MTADVRLVRWPATDRHDFDRLTSALGRIRAAVGNGADMIGPAVPMGPAEATNQERARALLQQGALRDRLFGDHAALFANPAWTIMLTLFVGSDGPNVTKAADLAALCGGSVVGATRWLAVLEERGLVCRSDDGDVRITPSGDAILADCLRAL